MTTSKSQNKHSKYTSQVRNSNHKEVVVAKQKPKRKRKLAGVKINLNQSKFEVIRRIAWEKQYGFGWKEETTNSELVSTSKVTLLLLASNNWDLYWADNGVSTRFFQQMRMHQVWNHFPGMNLITRKNTLAKTLKDIQKIEGNQDEYDFIPRTWILPNEAYELHEFTRMMKIKKKATNPLFIVKPEAGAQGNGIYLTRKVSDIPKTK